MNWIEVKQRIDRELTTVCIDADKIDYIKPGIADCGIHFINGQSIIIAETPPTIRKLLWESSKNMPGG
jgi:hypothetical protein